MPITNKKDALPITSLSLASSKNIRAPGPYWCRWVWVEDGWLFLAARNSKSLCAVVSLSAHELLQCREAVDFVSLNVQFALFS